MKCIVPGCNNDSAAVSKSAGISFHAIPTQSSHRTAWLNAIGVNPCIFKKNGGVVCSNHFLNNDLARMKQSSMYMGGIPIPAGQTSSTSEPMFIMYGGSGVEMSGSANNAATPCIYTPVTPVVLAPVTVTPLAAGSDAGSQTVAGTDAGDALKSQESTSCDNVKPAILKICRICLLMDTKLLSLKSCNLETAFSQLTGLPLEDSLPQEVCWECAQRVRNCARLRARAVKAHALMSSLLEREGHLSIDSLREINRESNRLTSNLRVNYLGNNHVDFIYIFKDDDPQTNTTGEMPHHIAKTKVEVNNEIYLLEENDNFYREDVKMDNEVDFEYAEVARNVNNGEPCNAQKMVLDCEIDRSFLSASANNYDDDGGNVERTHLTDSVHNTKLCNTQKNHSGEEFEYVDNKINTQYTYVVTITDDSELGNAQTVDSDEELEKQIDAFLAASDNEFLLDDTSLPKITKSKKKVIKKPKQKVERKVRKTIVKKPKKPKKLKQRKVIESVEPLTLFTIKCLTTEEQLEELEKRKESDNYKKSLYKCTECYRGFIEEYSYRSHMMQHTDKYGEYVCEICKSHYENRNRLMKHIRANHSQKYTCNECLFVTFQKQSALNHQRWHKGTQYTCEICGEVFTKITTLKSHMRIKHPSDIACEYCGYSFVSVKGLHRHRKLKHQLHDQQIPADGPYCAECDVRFASEQALRNHLGVSARHVTAKDTFQMNVMKPVMLRQLMASCGDSSWSEDYVPARPYSEGKVRRPRRRGPAAQRPLEIQAKKEPIDCEQCGLQLEDFAAYNGHFRRAHPDKNRTNYSSMKYPAMCELCGKILPRVYLPDHMYQHVSASAGKRYECDVCGKGFATKSPLATHLKLHSASRPAYECDQCGTRCSTRGNLQRHMKIHIGLKPFKCEICGKAFNQEDTKRTHKNFVHFKKPWPKRDRSKRRQLARAASASETNLGHKAGGAHASDDKSLCYNVINDSGECGRVE